MLHAATSTFSAALTCLPDRKATQQELFGSGRNAAAIAFALHLAQRVGLPEHPAWLWVQDRASIRLTGRPFIHGLPPALRSGLIHITAARPRDALFALEEGVRCTDFALVLGELAGDPRALDFTASRRLSIACERHGVPLYLVRHDAGPDLSAARRRWRVAPYPSAPPRWNARAPGAARWQVELFRARDLPPGNWMVSEDDGHYPGQNNLRHAAREPAGAAHPVDLVAMPRHRSLARVRTG